MSTTREFEVRYAKFIGLIVYILKQFPQGVPKTKFLKLLYFAEADHYAEYDKTISRNVAYFRHQYGPIPDIKVMEKVYGLDYLDNKIMQHFTSEERQVNVISLKQVRYQEFIDIQIDKKQAIVIDKVIERYGNLSTDEIVEESHKDTPYLAAADGQKIDFQFVNYRGFDEVDEDEEEINREDIVVEDITDQVSAQTLARLGKYGKNSDISQ